VSEFVVVTWTRVKSRLEQHEEYIKKNMDYWRKTAKRFNLRSMRYLLKFWAVTPSTMEEW
jgi:hypothetical protein